MLLQHHLIRKTQEEEGERGHKAVLNESAEGIGKLHTKKESGTVRENKTSRKEEKEANERVRKTKRKRGRESLWCLCLRIKW